VTFVRPVDYSNAFNDISRGLNTDGNHIASFVANHLAVDVIDGFVSRAGSINAYAMQGALFQKICELTIRVSTRDLMISGDSKKIITLSDEDALNFTRDVFKTAATELVESLKDAEGNIDLTDRDKALEARLEYSLRVAEKLKANAAFTA
jgi:hypothetical protein